MDATTKKRRSPARRGRNSALLLSLAVFLAGLPFARALVVGDVVALAVDGATAHLPWAAELEPTPVRNPELADQGVQFYPFYRWVAESWLSGDPPTWCPLVYAGAPGFGNAQSGALDPQVWLLVVCEALGGKAFFDWGLGLAAFLRLFLALTGAYLLARRLGLGTPGALLASVAFGFSGFQILWHNHALGHVPPFLPWTLYFLEGTRGSRPRLAAAGAALAFALAVLGGHVETAFYVGCAAGAWSLAILVRDRHAGLLSLAALALGTCCGAASLLATYEYLELSAAKYVRELSAEEIRSAVDLVALGLVVVVVGLVLAFRANVSARSGGESHERRARLLAVPGMVLALVGVAAFLAPRGLGIGARLALVPDLFGSPGAGGYRGEGTYIENASVWVVFPVLVLALASVLSARGKLARRNLVAWLGAVPFLLAIELPGLLELYRFVPFVGLGATVRAAPVAALMLGLLAGDALSTSGQLARAAAGLALAVLVAALLVDSGPTELPPGASHTPDRDELFGMALYPAEPTDGRDVALEGWVAGAVPFDRARLVIERHAGAERFELPLVLAPTPSSAEARDAGAAPEGAVWFRNPTTETGALTDGHWLLTVELLRADEPGPIGKRHAGVLTVHRGVEPRLLTVILLLGGLAAVLVAQRPRAAWCVLGLSVAQALQFAHGVNPLVPRERVFPSTRTEELLASELGAYRFFSDADVLPPNTGLVRGLRGIQGYDAMDVAAFNFYRENVLPGDVSALLAWNPRGVDLAHPAFRLYGVGFLVCGAPLEHPDWELFAAPDHSLPGRRAETWIYRARDPLPRAFCVPRVVSLEELTELFRADPEGFDPAAVACLAEDWRPTQPFTDAEVSVPNFTNTEVRLTARLDGDGLLILTDQAFPGWKVDVDGEERPVLTADQIFRGVALEAGEHEIVFRYEPTSIRVGMWISVLAVLGILALALTGVRRVPQQIVTDSRG